MRLEFQADEGGFYTPDDPMTFCLICGVEGRDADGVEHGLTIQRGTEDEAPAEDWGVHFCFDDQSNGDYNCIQKCRVTRSSIEVHLTHPIDQIHSVFADISGLSEEAFAAIRNGMPRIFRGTDGILEVA